MNIIFMLLDFGLVILIILKLFYLNGLCSFWLSHIDRVLTVHIMFLFELICCVAFDDSIWIKNFVD